VLQLPQQTERVGLRILPNDMVSHEGLRFAGLDDLWSGRFRSDIALAKLAAGEPAIFLSHTFSLQASSTSARASHNARLTTKPHMLNAQRDAWRW
jgi:hypothetical protein